MKIEKPLTYMFFLMCAVLFMVGACGSASDYSYMHEDCAANGGEVHKVGSQATCLKDGAVIAEWNEWS